MYGLKRRFPTCAFGGNVQVIAPHLLTLGQNVVIQRNCVLHCGGADWCQKTGSIQIGSGSVISPNTVIYGGGPGGVRIGERFECGPGVGIFSCRTDYLAGPGRHVFAPVRIGDDVIVYTNAVISPGVSVGRGAVVAACSVVTEDVPENCLVGGAPAKVLRTDIRHSASDKEGAA